MSLLRLLSISVVVATFAGCLSYIRFACSEPPEETSSNVRDPKAVKVVFKGDNDPNLPISVDCGTFAGSGLIATSVVFENAYETPLTITSVDISYSHTRYNTHVVLDGGEKRWCAMLFMSRNYRTRPVYRFHYNVGEKHGECSVELTFKYNRSVNVFPQGNMFMLFDAEVDGEPAKAEITLVAESTSIQIVNTSIDLKYLNVHHEDKLVESANGRIKMLKVCGSLDRGHQFQGIASIDVTIKDSSKPSDEAMFKVVALDQKAYAALQSRAVKPSQPPDGWEVRDNAPIVIGERYQNK